MEKSGLKPELTAKFPEDALDQTCERAEKFELQDRLRSGKENMSIQKELVKTPEFAVLYRALCDYGVDDQPVTSMLRSAEDCGEQLIQYPQERVLAAAGADLPTSLRFYYMKYYLPLIKYEEEEQAIIDNLNTFPAAEWDEISTLTDAQRGMMRLPFLGPYLFNWHDNERTALELLEQNRPLQRVLALLYRQGVTLALDTERIKDLGWVQMADVMKFRRLLGVFDFDTEDLDAFFERWLQNHAGQYDLNWFISGVQPVSYTHLMVTMEMKEAAYMERALPCMEREELRGTGLVEWLRKHPVTDPEKYLAVWKHVPKMEQIWKAGLPALTKECFERTDSVRKQILYPDEPRLIRALGLDGPRFQRLRQIDGDTEDLAWLQLEKRTGQNVSDDMLAWLKKERITARDLIFISDRMSLVQIKNYLQKQKQYFDGSCRQALFTWQDYLAMAERLHYDTSDEIIYRVRKLRQRHDELVIQSEAGSLEEQAAKMAAKYPHVDAICMELQKKYAYADEDYTVLAPQNIFEIIKEGRMLHHCVGNDGSGERYYERIERQESFIMFLRRTNEPEDPYYTLEIEPDGTVRQKRTLFDRQYEDIEQASEFLLKWQKAITARLTRRDLKLAARSRELRKEEFIQMQKDRVIIHTGHLAGCLLADVLLADLMENKEVMQQQELPAAA